MTFLRGLFWIVFAIVVAAFSMNNWQRVTLRLWSDVLVDINLPVLVVLAFLAGLLPGMILHRTGRWRMRRRLDSAERALAGAAPPAEEPLAPSIVEAP